MTSTIVGEGGFSYRMAPDWGDIPDDWSIGDVAAVAVDRADRVYVFNRGEHPMVVLDRDGRVLRTWGEGVFVRPHGLHIGPDDMLYCTDDGDHTVRRCTPEGRVELMLGLAGRPAPYMSGLPFHRCTHTALSPDGDIYVADGYGNARVHKYAPDGRLLRSWGTPGIGPGEFNIVHNICADRDGWVYVADRENHRIQVFDRDGNFEAEWHHVHRPCALCMSDDASPRFFVGEIGPTMPVNRGVQNLGPRLSVLDREGKLLARIGAPGAGTGPGQFVAPHGLALDSRGDLYVAEVATTSWPQLFPDRPPPRGLRGLKKLVLETPRPAQSER